MEREVKFRGRRLFGSRWEYGHYDKDSRGDAFIRHPDTDNPKRIDVYQVDPDTVGQFTGLYDRNGKEIYEGDVVLWKRKNVHIEGRPLQDFSDVCKIYYDNKKHAFCFWYKMSCGSVLGFLNFNDNRAEESYIEVIGNIHDNPEIMKGGEE